MPKDKNDKKDKKKKSFLDKVGDAFSSAEKKVEHATSNAYHATTSALHHVASASEDLALRVTSDVGKGISNIISPTISSNIIPIAIFIVVAILALVIFI